MSSLFQAWNVRSAPSICEDYVSVLDLVAGRLLNDLVCNNNPLVDVRIDLATERILGLDANGVNGVDS